MPRADAPRCPTPPTAAGRELRTHAGTIYLPGSVSLRLPPGFVESSLGAIANDPSRGLIAHWIDTTAGSVAGAVVSLTGAPTGGFGAFGSDRAARQLSLAECRSDVPHAGTAVVEFAVAEPGRGTLHLLQAVWPLASDRWLVWTASTRREADLPGLRAALASVRVAE
ncbi:MAG: hypothetical protein JO180_07890 [Gemmatirosa sp.]|nr:hypothetical protein [Gemmatirosa sp.]